MAEYLFSLLTNSPLRRYNAATVTALTYAVNLA